MEATVLFVLVDAGESNMLCPAIRLLDSPKVLCFGTAETLPLSLGSAQVLKGQELGLSKPITKTTPRTEELDLADLAVLESLLCSVKVIVTGVAAKVQQQLLERCTGRKIMVWDNFKGNDTGEYWRNAHSMLPSADIVLFPAQSTINELPISVPHSRVVGQPALEEWSLKIHSIDQVSVRSRLDIGESDRVVLYIAGWSGDSECAEGTRLFSAIVAELLLGTQVLVQLHPRSDGQFERQLFGSLARVTSNKDCTTEEATSISCLVVCHKSTAGLKIGAAGKPLIFAIPQPDYTNPMIDAGLAPMVKTVAEFRAAYEGITSSSKDFYQTLNIPREAAQRIKEEILGLLD